MLRGQTPQHRDCIFTTHANDNRMNVYPSRAVRDERWKYIRNLHPEFAFTTHIDLVAGRLGQRAFFSTWETAAENDPAAAAILKRYHARPAEELYDLTADPHEQQNLAGEPRPAETLARLRAELDEWMNAQGDQQPVLAEPRLLSDPTSHGPESRHRLGQIRFEAESQEMKPLHHNMKRIFTPLVAIMAALDCHGRLQRPASPHPVSAQWHDPEAARLHRRQRVQNPGAFGYRRPLEPGDACEQWRSAVNESLMARLTVVATPTNWTVFLDKNRDGTPDWVSQGLPYAGQCYLQTTGPGSTAAGGALNAPKKWQGGSLRFWITLPGPDAWNLGWWAPMERHSPAFRVARRIQARRFPARVFSSGWCGAETRLFYWELHEGKPIRAVLFGD